jgi:pyridoxine 4-dehydrogenase
MSPQVLIGELPVKRIGLGTNRITDTPKARAALQYALKLGINFIDTAYLYTGGASEATIGGTLAPYPDGLVVASKGGYDNQPDYNSQPVLRANLEESRRRLQTDRITLYHLHRIDRDVPLQKTMAVLKSFQAEGKVQYLGLSEADVNQIEEARQYADIVSVQNEYSLTERKHDAVVDYCTENKIVFIPWYPLHGTDEHAELNSPITPMTTYKAPTI